MAPSTANQAILGTELREHGRESRKGKKNLTHSLTRRTNRNVRDRTLSK